MSREDVYIALARMYNWSHETIANLNPVQQYKYLRGPQIVQFETEAEYNEYMRNKK